MRVKCHRPVFVVCMSASDNKSFLISFLLWLMSNHNALALTIDFNRRLEQVYS